MNAGIPDSHASIHYYDSDYPSPNGKFAENFDEVTPFQGLAFDLQRYLEIASKVNGPILELCCGTGRVAIALARDSHNVVAVDLSPGMLAQFRSALKSESSEVTERIALIEQDITTLSLSQRS